jgi:hypothetical protein
MKYTAPMILCAKFPHTIYSLLMKETELCNAERHVLAKILTKTARKCRY